MIDLFSVILQPLEKSGVDYMVTGSVAAMTYGEPRLTNDIDIVISVRPEHVGELVEAFPAADYYISPLEVLLLELERGTRGHTNIVHHGTGFRADVYFAGTDPLHQWAWPLRQRLTLSEDLTVSFAPSIYVILRKLEFFREGHSSKHLTDIAGILAANASSVTDPELEDWVEKLHLEREWQAALREAGV